MSMMAGLIYRMFSKKLISLFLAIMRDFDLGLTV